MNAPEAFFDSNVLLYLGSTGARPARVRELLDIGGAVSVQVLNEISAVARRKFAMQWVEIHDLLGVVRSACRIEPLTLGTHERGIALAERYRLNVYDSMIVAAAIDAGCATLFSEDMHHGQRIEGTTIRNPFAGI